MLPSWQPVVLIVLFSLSNLVSANFIKKIVIQDENNSFPPIAFIPRFPKSLEEPFTVTIELNPAGPESSENADQEAAAFSHCHHFWTLFSNFYQRITRCFRQSSEDSDSNAEETDDEKALFLRARLNRFAENLRSGAVTLSENHKGRMTLSFSGDQAPLQISNLNSDIHSFRRFFEGGETTSSHSSVEDNSDHTSPVCILTSPDSVDQLNGHISGTEQIQDDSAAIIRVLTHSQLTSLSDNERSIRISDN